jgi:peptidoglycan DL-endopeptidase CwlO
MSQMSMAGPTGTGGLGGAGGLADIAARIAQLQALAPPVTPAGAGGGFAGALAQAVQQSGTGKIAGQAADQAADQPASAAVGEQAVKLGKEYLGVPYLWGGTDPDRGLDCSGLTQLVYQRLGIDLPRVSRDQAKAGTEVASLKQARPGDLVFFGSPVHHVGIYAGNGMMVEAARRGTDVRVGKVWANPTHIRRVTGPDTPGGSDGSGSGVGALRSGIGGLDAQQALAALLGGAGPSAATGASGPRTSQRGGSGSMGTPYDALFAAAGRKHGVQPALLAAVAKAESGFDPAATSRAGARGLMQLMPATARGLGVDPLVPSQAVDGAARLLSGYLRDYDGRTDLALAAYNAGPGAVRRYDGVPPYDETRTYIQRVTRYQEDLR